MSTAKRWAKFAEDTEFEQLTGARKQAEGWRTGLAGLTALLAAVTIIKGPDSITDLATWARWVVLGLLLAAFVLLVLGSLVATRAASGDPGDEIYLDGDQLRTWMYKEAKSVGDDIRLARTSMVAGLTALALATGLTWMGPREHDAAAPCDGGAERRPAVRDPGPDGRPQSAARRPEKAVGPAEGGDPGRRDPDHSRRELPVDNFGRWPWRRHAGFVAAR